jgi:hypothetical protein
MAQAIKEHITTIECPKCGEGFIYVPPSHSYVVIDDVRYLTPTPVCDLLEVVSRERDALQARIKELEGALRQAHSYIEEVQDDFMLLDNGILSDIHNLIYKKEV